MYLRLDAADLRIEYLSRPFSRPWIEQALLLPSAVRSRAPAAMAGKSVNAIRADSASSSAAVSSTRPLVVSSRDISKIASWAISAALKSESSLRIGAGRSAT